MAVAEVLKRAWIPLVVLAVVGGGGFSVSRVRAASTMDKPSAYGKQEATGVGQLAQKSVMYEVFGPTGAVADISYFDVNSDPQLVDRARLPWSIRLTTNSPAVVGNVVAQGDSNSIGCRIVVDGQVKAERISNEVSAFTYCRIKA
ncbi:MmpS family transport accessory protein [Candidatus Mycobacterium wuenschmannii]|uniref:MmpS family transport accessory protein n=1 Tax=Candidatus Mycobacterium wuenschmannii TaxID=3027808 RepID=A0ABY8W3B6_9MYCO|nr:MmpS family transport accessory protein [Candidatus Mycobacterium wuenschmannii]WIM89846.1 MmpS family transport accessory protein [Candidatus Mycobacterium wuenschmannii]